MSHLNFWKGWRKDFRSIYQVLLFIFFLSVAYSFYTQYFSVDLASPLEEVRKTQSIDLSVHNIYDFVFELNVPTRNYVVYQGFLALKSGFQPWNSYLLLGIIFFCFSILLTASTYFNRLWFMVFQSVFVVWIITLKLQYLEIFGIESQLFTFLFIGLFLGIGYIYHAFKKEAGLFQRWLSFSITLAALVALVAFGSGVDAPVVFMTHHGIIVPVILSVLFIFNVAYEIILHILYLLAGKKNEEGNSNLWHFLILSFLYLVYVALTFARNSFLIDLNIVYLDEFILLAISAILGIWGFRKRSELFSKQLAFRPLGAYLYLVLGIITFSTISWIFSNGNDPLVETFEDMIVFSHLGFGLLFLIYVLYNFVALLNAGHGIYPVVFRPVNIPYTLVRLIGFGVVVALVLRVTYLPYYQAVSGYYNSLGDYYEYVDNNEAAKTTFKIARQYAVTNHKSNFEIGQMEYNDKNWAEASSYFKQAAWKRPSVQAYINRAQTQLNASLYFEALFTLEAAQKDIPDNPYILNMMGLVYDDLNKIDSSFIYFDAAVRASNTESIKNIAESNKLALFAKNRVNEELPGESSIQDKPVPYQANYIALANQKRKVLEDFVVSAKDIDTFLTYNDFSFLFNYTLNKTIAHKSFTGDSIGWLKEFKENKTFFKSIDYAIASRENYAGDQKSAYSLIYDLENSEISDAGFYYLTHGLWLYEQGAYNMAHEKFQQAEKLKMSEASTFRVIALIQAGRLYEAARIYEEQFKGMVVDDQVLKQDPLYQFLQGNPEELPDSFLYLWLKTNASLQPEEKKAIKDQLANSPFLALYQMEKVVSLVEDEKPEEAWEKLDSINIAKEEIGLSVFRNNLKALLIAKLNKIDQVDGVDTSELSVYPRNYKLLFDAFLSRNSVDSVKANQLMWRLGNENVFFDQGVIMASEYFRSKGEQEKAYGLLVEAARLNESSIPILKAYILQALRLNLTSYASESMDDLEKMLTTEEYENFQRKYNEIKELNSQEPW
ncbi:hypothetical protein JKA74_20500 [Marivirga sp. S37H4]|uniref:Uncharacterized protein n=1 Tax=Marivirga aurantiaca TaxID=2802615 RepID=A0A935CDZ6_9BACT|nr:hypothetical protein [Marivirga aurantiaca]MBK6267433.1 hypothetical protein [Marivirga aurantiaca]